MPDFKKILIRDFNATDMTQRTDQQRKAIEVYCREVAKAMNDAGHTVQTAFTADVDISQDNIKQNMFKVVMKKLYPNKESTTELETHEVTDVYENMNRITAERYGVSMQFPDYFNEG